jgi:hypothetical protein
MFRTPYSTKSELFGIWVATKCGLNTDALLPVDQKTAHAYIFFEDGVFLLRAPGIIDPTERDHTWQVIGDDLVITIAVAPMPDYGLHDWTYEDKFERILSISSDKLVLDSRPHGGEAIIAYIRSAQP